MRGALKKVSQSVFIFAIIFAWIFSGWPQVWQNPTFPPKIQESQASSHKFLAFWDGGTPPSGWVCVSCSGGDDFFEVFLRGAATAGGTGGSATHDHSQSFVSNTDGASTNARSSQGNSNTGTHTHGYTGNLSGRTAAATNLPSYRNLKIIRYDTVGDPPNIPDGVILIFDADPGSGWTRYADQDDKFIRGGNDATSVGGQDTHTHEVSGTLTTSSDTSGFGGSGFTGSDSAHTHAVTGTTASSDHAPVYRNVLLYKNTSGSAKSFAGGEIFMSTGDPGSGWTVLSGSGGDFENRFIRGAASYGSTGGGAEHTPSNVVITSGVPSVTLAISLNGNPQGALANSDHTHNTTLSFDAANHLPPYRDVIVAKKDTPVGNTPPDQPTNSSPADTATSVSVNPTLTGSTYSDDDSDLHADTEWRVDNDSNFSSPVWTRNAGIGEVSTIVNTSNGTFANELSGETGLAFNTQYYWQVRYFDGEDWSSWSDATSFTTVSVVVSITIDTTEFAYGKMGNNTASTTLSLFSGDGITIENTGNVNVDIDIFGANTDSWTLAGSTGSDQYIHQFCNGTTNACYRSVSYFNELTTSPQAFATGIVPSDTVALQLRIVTPNPSTVYSTQSAAVTVQATAQ